MSSWDNAHLGRLHAARMHVPTLPPGHCQARCPQPSRSSQHQVALALKLPMGLLAGKHQKHPLSQETLLDRLVCALLKRGNQSALRASDPEQRHPPATSQGVQPLLEREAQREGTGMTRRLSISHGALKGNSPEPQPPVLCRVMD